MCKNKFFTPSRIIGIILIFVAAALYIKELTTTDISQETLSTIHGCISNRDAIAAVSVFLDTEGETKDISVLLPQEDSNKFLDALESSIYVEFPKDQVEGDPFLFVMLYTNQTSVILEAARLYEENPSDLYVRMRVPSKYEKHDDKAIVKEWAYTGAVLLKDMGDYMNQIKEKLLPTIKESAPTIRKKIEEGKAELIKNATPAEAPTTEATVVEEPKAEAPAVVAPTVVVPAVDTPTVEKPKAPVIETPAIEVPIATTTDAPVATPAE